MLGDETAHQTPAWPLSMSVIALRADQYWEARGEKQLGASLKACPVPSRDENATGTDYRTYWG